MSLQNLPKTWDLIIIGGGITGAGILREATRTGLKAILIEQKDFAWGTSSRSSKLVHGGLRYIKEGHLMLTKVAVAERDRLLAEAPGLVESLGFWLPVYQEQKPGKGLLKVGLTIYDIMAREWQHRFYNKTEFVEKLPLINPIGLKGGFHYIDAQVDDSRLVLRLINEAVACGAYALNYTSVRKILRNGKQFATGVEVEDVEDFQTRRLLSSAIINATGFCAEKLHPSPQPDRHLRPLRGSHLVFPAEVLPISQGIGFNHPRDDRWVFVVPWEGTVLVGTTDLDHSGDLSLEPTATDDEVSYLMEGIHAVFPSQNISTEDCIATFAGLRPVLSEGKRAPSEESREHVVWVDKGLITVTGGKLTTFRRLAWDALKAAKSFLPPSKLPNKKDPIFSKVPNEPEDDFGLSNETWRRLYGRYGMAADRLVRAAAPHELTLIPGTQTLWAELPFVARSERVRHLDDLLLRRVRIGLLTPHGGKAYLKRIRKICRKALHWNRRRWKKEIDMYLKQWNRAHAPPVKQDEILSKRKNIFSRALFELRGTISSKIRSTRRKSQTF